MDEDLTSEYGEEQDEGTKPELNNNQETVQEEKANDEEIPDELKRKKKARILKPFTEEDLTSKAGLKQIYKTFPDKCKGFGRNGHEGRDLNNLLNLYKEWSFRLHPGLAFSDMLNRIDTFGSKGSVKVELTKLRNQERKRYLDGLSVLTKSDETSSKPYNLKQDSTTNINLESSMTDDVEISNKIDEFHNNQVVDQIIDTAV